MKNLYELVSPSDIISHNNGILNNLWDIPKTKSFCIRDTYTGKWFSIYSDEQLHKFMKIGDNMSRYLIQLQTTSIGRGE